MKLFGKKQGTTDKDPGEPKATATGAAAAKPVGRRIWTSKWFYLLLLTLILVGAVTWMVKEFLAARQEGGHGAAPVAHAPAPAAPTPAPTAHAPAPAPSAHAPAAPTGHAAPAKSHNAPVSAAPGNRGVAFVDAAIVPLSEELHRFWGWRPNDLIEFTDNVNNFQRGVLEVTRRTSVALAENLSRTGSTDAYVPSLESAMNLFMVNPSAWIWPSAESSYQNGLDELAKYRDMLATRQARFYNRLDNLVPLIRAYESILGSCDETLSKDLGNISWSEADDRLYYSRGVASAMLRLLEAVREDFGDTIVSVQGMELLEHAISSLEHAEHINPYLVLEGGPNSVLANHRANMAAAISHARFYLGVMITTLTGNIS